MTLERLGFLLVNMILKRKIIGKSIDVEYNRVKCWESMRTAVRPCKLCVIRDSGPKICKHNIICRNINYRFSAPYGLYKYAIV